jgi:hypothetical protein
MPRFSFSSFLALRTILAVVVTAAVCAFVPSLASAAPPVGLSGAFDGWGAASSSVQFGQWRGAPATVAEDYLGYDSWDDIEYPSTLLSDWSAFHTGGGQLVLSVPMLVSDTPGTFAAGATGAYDQYFLAMGKALVAQGFGSSVLRLGWEFDQTWSPWSIQPGSSTMGTTAFVAYYQHLVTLLRSIPGANFKFDWTVTPGVTDISPADAYPGNAYVDYVGMDIYDRGWSATGGPISDPAARWQQLTTQTEGLDYWTSFAADHSKQLAVGEWGLWNDLSTNGGGDDPYFIQQMYNWMKTNNVAYEMYFDAKEPAISSATDPQASAEYKALWGDTSTTTSTSTTTNSTATGSTGTTTTGSTGTTTTGSTGTTTTGSTGTTTTGSTGTTTTGSTGTTTTGSTGTTTTGSTGTTTTGGTGTTTTGGTGTTTTGGTGTTTTGTTGTASTSGTPTAGVVSTPISTPAIAPDSPPVSGPSSSSTTPGAGSAQAASGTEAPAQLSSGGAPATPASPASHAKASKSKTAKSKTAKSKTAKLKASRAAARAIAHHHKRASRSRAHSSLAARRSQGRR